MLKGLSDCLFADAIITIIIFLHFHCIEQHLNKLVLVYSLY